MTLKECYDEALLKGYLDDALPASEHEDVDAHLATCEDCRVKLGEMKALAMEVNDTLEAHIDVPDARIALARLHVAQRANGTAVRAGARNTRVEDVPALTSVRAVPPQSPAPQGHIRFALAGMGVALAIVVALGLTMLFAPTPQSMVQNTGDIEQFLPDGKVRHMIYVGTYTTQNPADKTPAHPTEQHHEEFWLTAGTNHPLMRDQVTVPISATNWLDNNTYYEYEPSNGNQVHQYPYDPKYLAAVMPDPEIITKTLQLPNAHVVGDENLGGRHALVIQASGSEATDQSFSTTVKYWIDTITDQLLQYEAVTTTTVGLQKGQVAKVVNKIALDELRDRSEFPSDFFKISVPLNPPAVPAANVPGWYTFTSPYGAFSVLMPRQLVEISGSDSWNYFGVKNGAVTYMAGYRDYTNITNPNDPDQWLDQELPDISANMSGVPSNIKQVTLGGNTGREFSIDRIDGRLTRARVYLVGTRVYKVYAIAVDEATAYSREVDRYLDSLRLITP